MSQLNIEERIRTSESIGGRDKMDKAGPTPSAYSVQVFVGKHMNTPSRIYCSNWGELGPPF